MVAAENELLQELPLKMWTFEPASVRAYELCRGVEDFDYSLLRSDKAIYFDQDDWIACAELAICAGSLDPRVFARVADTMPVRSYILLGAVVAFCDGLDEFAELRAWARSQQPLIYDRMCAAVRAAASTGDTRAIRLALYLLRPEDLTPLRDTTALDLSGEPNADCWLHKLAALPGLRELNLSGASPLAEHLSALSALTSLEELDLTATDVGNPDMRWVENLPALRSVKR